MTTSKLPSRSRREAADNSAGPMERDLGMPCESVSRNSLPIRVPKRTDDGLGPQPAGMAGREPAPASTSPLSRCRCPRVGCRGRRGSLGGVNQGMVAPAAPASTCPPVSVQVSGLGAIHVEIRHDTRLESAAAAERGSLGGVNQGMVAPVAPASYPPPVSVQRCPVSARSRSKSGMIRAKSRLPRRKRQPWGRQPRMVESSTAGWGPAPSPPSTAPRS